jgi:hypothetical protein
MGQNQSFRIRPLLEYRDPQGCPQPPRGAAVSNDGDARFPALSLLSRAVVYAPVYSVIPALIVEVAAFYGGF